MTCEVYQVAYQRSTHGMGIMNTMPMTHTRVRHKSYIGPAGYTDVLDDVAKKHRGYPGCRNYQEHADREQQASSERTPKPNLKQ
jgi:hypothetical protein